MKDLKKKQRIAFMMTIVTLANLWSCLIYQSPQPLIRSFFVMVAVSLIGATIDRWCRFAKAYINYTIDKKLDENKR